MTKVSSTYLFQSLEHSVAVVMAVLSKSSMKMLATIGDRTSHGCSICLFINHISKVEVCVTVWL